MIFFAFVGLGDEPGLLASLVLGFTELFLALLDITGGLLGVMPRLPGPCLH